MNDESRRFARDIAVQAFGTVIGGLLLLIAAKVGGLLTGVDWKQVASVVGTPVIVALVGLAISSFVKD